LSGGDEAVVERAAMSDITNSSPGPLWTGTPSIVGRAISNYSASEVARIKGAKSTQIAELLGYADSEYVALRENISFFQKGSKTSSGVDSPAKHDDQRNNDRWDGWDESGSRT